MNKLNHEHCLVHNDQKLCIKCDPIGDGVIVHFNYKGKFCNRIFTDKDLSYYLGNDMYVAFEHVSKKLREIHNVTDFNDELLTRDFPVETIKDCESKIRQIVPLGQNVVECWRRIKCTLAVTTTLITNYDWNKYQVDGYNPTVGYASHNNSFGEYIYNCLTSISKNSKCLLYQKCARYYLLELTKYKPLLYRNTESTCYKFRPPQCQKCVDYQNDHEINQWGPVVFGILLAILIILIIIYLLAR